MLNSNVDLDPRITLPHPEAMLAGARLARSLENDPFPSWFSGMDGYEILRDPGRAFLAAVDEWRIELHRMQEAGAMETAALRTLCARICDTDAARRAAEPAFFDLVH